MSLENKKVLIFVDNNFEDQELFYPKFRMIEAGAKVIIAGPKEKETYKSKYGYPCLAAISFDQVNVSDFDGLIIPGGYAPDKLRKIPRVLEITKQFHEEKKLVAFICHAGWILISSKILKGIKCTSYETIKDDMINAGAHWVDESVVVDNNIISSRCPDDLPNFSKEIIKFFQKK